MPYERLRPSFVFDEERLKQLQQIAPEAFADGKINWEVLKESLGEHLEEEGQEAEHFGLFWPGKRQARKVASIPSKGTLIPVKGEGINEDTTKNIFIEGENLEVLKLLQKGYAGKIKMIYIDPPYNTGNDFIYDDNFTEPLEEYLKYTGQMDEEGKLLTTNKRADGRFHSKWLSMMYPRLRLARNLLSEEGLIFISIGDNEVDNLKKICLEVFGEENFVGIISRITKTTSDSGNYFAPSVDYIICFAKNILELKAFKISLSEEQIKEYRKEDKKGKYKLVGFYQASLTLERSRNARYYIQCPDGTKCIPPENKRWRCVEETFIEMKKNDEIEFIQTGSSPLLDDKNNKSKWNVYTKQYLDRRLDEGKVPRNFIDDIPNVIGSKELIALGIPFDFPKPSPLVKYLMEVSGCNNSDIIMDFFAGSCTVAHAVLMANSQDEHNRQFICIQLPELTEDGSAANKNGFKYISEIGKERIRRVIKKEKLKYGFRVYKLSRSNFYPWQNYSGNDLNKLKDLFEKQQDSLVDGWKTEDLLVEVMLQEGFSLDSDVVEIKDHKKNKVVQVSSCFCQHKLLVSFDKKIAQDTIDNLKIQGEDIFVCLDNALTDEQKVTLSDKGFLKTI